VAKVISAYNTDQTGADAPKDITKTDVSGNKVALDVAIKEGSVSGEFTQSGLTIGGLVTEVTLNSATWTALPATALTDRNGMGIQNDSAIQIKVGFDNTEPGFVGWNVNPNGEFFVDITDSVIIYAKSASGTPTVTVMEVA
jgi:hypothetical protein